MLDIAILPAFNDNYIYLLREPETSKVAVVDPGTADPVLTALEARGWPLDMILLTHHHADHVGGVDTLKERFGAEVVGPAADANRISGLDRGVGEGDEVPFGAESALVYETHGHTRGHIAFWFPGSTALFSGDTLFALGCGRLFEGTPAEMWASLQKLRGLPDDARVYCGHEYTESNARFAVTVEPENEALAERAAQVRADRSQGRPTVPSLLGLEKRTNPFLRADVPEVQAALGKPGADPVAVFADIRARKDSF
ncbi:MAG: hydroxyacylglutathione hydrolase [Alphaproteobacteria bacterium]|jgi:hydroxyacylglutathione hydrolase|nr:hydroxyacylglutathione hydrolase [Alphaproteobacteria bacterium]